MKIKAFIEKAIKGGWRPVWWCDKYKFIFTEKLEDWEYEWETEDENGNKVMLQLYCNFEKRVQAILLDPKAWQAVGKVEGWNKKAYWRSEDAEMTQAEFYVHNMVEHLFEGGTIESYLETL